MILKKFSTKEYNRKIMISNSKNNPNLGNPILIENKSQKDYGSILEIFYLNIPGITASIHLK